MGSPTSAMRPAWRRDERELLLAWQQRGDRAARDEVFGRFLPLARKIARRYANDQEPFEDLVQVACVGLAGAVNRFDPTRDTTFVAFAIPTITGELMRYFRDGGWAAHVPRHAKETALRVERAISKLTSPGGRPPSVAALAEYLGVAAENVLLGLEAGGARYATSWTPDPVTPPAWSAEVSLDEGPPGAASQV